METGIENKIGTWHKSKKDFGLEIGSTNGVHPGLE